MQDTEAPEPKSPRATGSKCFWCPNGEGQTQVCPTDGRLHHHGRIHAPYDRMGKRMATGDVLEHACNDCCRAISVAVNLDADTAPVGNRQAIQDAADEGTVNAIRRATGGI